MGSSLRYKQIITVIVLVIALSSIAVTANQPGIRLLHARQEQFTLNDGITVNNIVQAGSVSSRCHVMRGNLYAPSKLCLNQVDIDPVHCSRSSVSSGIVLGGNYSFWALDSWKAFNGIDDDGDEYIDFTGLDWDEAIYLINTTVMAVTDPA